MFGSLKDIAKVSCMFAVVCAATVGGDDTAAAQPRGSHDPIVATTIHAHEWQAYSARFITADGRVVDVEKQNQSHSEGQGYGMLLAVRANDRTTFDRIMRFTFANMAARRDGLISWLYNPRALPRVVDRNNASDGDILIAYALLSAGLKWNEARYISLAMPLVDAIGTHLLEERGGLVRLKPGAFGFDPGQHHGGPVVNLSYYIFGAFLLFDAVDDKHPWLEAWQSGLMMTEASLAGRERLSPDWISMGRGNALRPADGFAARSGYDAVRIPLYMALGGRVPARYFAAYDRAWNVAGRGMPVDYDLAAGQAVMDMNEPGYHAIAGIAACVTRGVPLNHSASTFRLKTYFSSSLHLLALSAVRAHYPQCARPTTMASAHYGHLSIAGHR